MKDVELFYDTTFNTVDFYMSATSIQHQMFKELPVIPIAYITHERLFQACHENSINELKKKSKINLTPPIKKRALLMH